MRKSAPINIEYYTGSASSRIKLIKRFFYNFFVLLISPLVALVFLCYRRGRERWLERFGLCQKLAVRDPYIWFHAASAGEVGGLLPIVRLIRASDSKIKLRLSCTSPTGLNKAEQNFDYKTLAPFDCNLFIRKAVGKHLPKLVVISETDFWPELIHYFCDRGVPIYYVNTRISSDYQRNFWLLAHWVRPALLRVEKFYCQDCLSADRLLQFKIAKAQIEVVGNSKFDHLEQYLQRALVDFTFKHDQPLVVLGSLRPGEEAFWFKAIKQFEERISFVVVPRHLEFIKELRAKFDQQNQGYCLWSEQRLMPDKTCLQPLIVDSIGELINFYSIASLAFIGGTLVPGYGGHNPLEPAAFEVPIMIGPHNSNQEGMYADLLAASACLTVETEQQIVDHLQRFVDQGRAAFESESSAAKNYLIKQLGTAEILAAKIVERIR